MTRLWTSGAEANDPTVEGLALALAVATSTGTVRSGARSFKPTGSQSPTFAFTGATGRSYYFRAYINIESNVGGSTAILTTSAGGAGLDARLDASRLLTLTTQAGTQIGSPTAALDTGRWYRVELRMKVGVGATDEAELLLDGVQVAASTTQNVTDSAPASVILNNGGGSTIYYDDVALNDDQGASQNTWPGDAKVVLLLPTSDNSAGSWRAGSAANAAANGALFNGIDNTPPVGTATPMAVTAGISNAISGATNPNGDFNMTKYGAAGVMPWDRVNCVQQIIVHGEDVATSTKTGTFKIVSNPDSGSADTVSDSGTNVFGPAGSGAVGTYPSNWIAQRGTIVYAPSVDVNAAPVARITKTDTGTRAADLCFMGIYVDYTPGPPGLQASRSPLGPSAVGPILAQ